VTLNRACVTGMILTFQTCKQLNAVASSSLNIGFSKADQLHAVIQREVCILNFDNYYHAYEFCVVVAATY